MPMTQMHFIMPLKKNKCSFVQKTNFGGPLARVWVCLIVRVLLPLGSVWYPNIYICLV